MVLISGYLGAIGAFLTHPRTRTIRGSFSENFSCVTQHTIMHALGVLDQMPVRFLPFPKLANAETYTPDTLILKDAAEQRYWIDILERNVASVLRILHNEAETKEENTRQFEMFSKNYRAHLAKLRESPHIYGHLSVRALLNLKEQCLHEVGFKDLFCREKKKDVELSLQLFPQIIAQINQITCFKDKVRKLVENVWAGNMFDWGSMHIMDLLQSNQLTFENALKKISVPPRINQIDQFIARLETKKYEKVVIFADNSGADFVLGIIPFARFLLEQGSVVVLAANSFPAINDITVLSIIS